LTAVFDAAKQGDRILTDDEIYEVITAHSAQT
jgi:hypothetical protein